MSRRFQPHRVTELRRQAGWSREQLAAAAHTTFDSVRAWERGKNAPRADKLVLLLDALGCSIDDLFTADEA